MKLERNINNPKRYYYLSQEDSVLYDAIKDSNDPKDKIIKRLILDKHEMSRHHNRAWN